MKNSNRYKDIFSPKENLSIEDINRYDSSTGVERNNIEQKEMNSNFEKDAMDGWESIDYDTSILSKQKNPFTSKFNNALYIILGAIVIGLVTSIVVYSTQEKEPENDIVPEQTDTAKKIVLESNDIFLPKEIEEMKEQPIDEQISINEIKHDFQKIEEINASLPVLKPHQIQKSEQNDIILQQQKAKELYLNDLKLIDYSIYRNESFIETKQFILTGTPADLEDENNEEYQTEWKTIDQPYSIYIENTLYYFNIGEYKKALARFDIILEKYEDDINANFYSGLCLYNFGEYDEAILRFEKCMNSNFNNFNEEALWMIANSYEENANLMKAQKIYEEIIKTNGFYKEQAVEKLNQLKR